MSAEIWICQKCKAGNEPDFNFCWSCGSPATLLSESQAKPSSAEVAEKFLNATAVRKKRIGPRTELPADDAPRDDEDKLRARPVREKIPPVSEPVERKSPLPGGEVEDRDAHRAYSASPSGELTISNASNTGPGHSSEAVPPEIHRPELFSTLSIGPDAGSEVNDLDDEKQRQVFAIAVRIFGLALLFLFVTGIPDFAARAISVISAPQGSGFWSSFAVPLLLPAARLLFYLIAGIYLISSGRILIRLLPR